MKRLGLFTLVLAAWVFSLFPGSAQTSETPPPSNAWRQFSAYLPLRVVDPADPPPLVAPAWVADVTLSPGATGVVHEILLEEYGHYFDYLLCRVYWESPSPPILVRTYDRDGRLLFEGTVEDPGNPGLLSTPLAIPAADVARIEITDPEYATHALYLAWLEGRLHFAPVDEPELPAFHNPHNVPNQPAPPPNDQSLNGVVSALLSPTEHLQPVPDQNLVLYELDLTAPPERAMLLCDIAGTTVDAPPSLYLNGAWLGPLEIQWPDLADPGFAAGQSLGPDGADLYVGRTIARKMLPAGALRPGMNSLMLALPGPSGAVHLRDVRLQVKFPWSAADAATSPAP